MIILYHANCNDGSSSALAAWMKLGDDGHSYIPVMHGKPPPKEVVGQDVVIVDFCYPRDVLENMGAKSIHILDHHISAKKDLSLPFAASKNISFLFDMNKSGAVLSWEYFFPERELPLLFRYVQDRDIWNNQYPQAKWLSYGLETYSKDFRDWQQLVDDPQKLEQAVQGGKSIFTFIRNEADKLMKNRNYMSIAGHKVPVVNAPSFLASDILHYILEQDPSAPFAAAYSDLLDQGKRYYSLRSEDHREDVSVIAKSFGGGGHRNASGFSVPLKLEAL